MITIKTEEEIKILREGGKKLAEILKKISAAVQPGISTIEFDKLAEQLVLSAGGKLSFKGYQANPPKFLHKQKLGRAYPSSICVSINDEVVHGIPSVNRILREGDIVSLDLGMEFKGLYTDKAITVPVGKIDTKAERLLAVCQKALDKGIKIIQERKHIGDIGFAIQNYVESRGFSVVRELVGHGVGYDVHEDPDIPNWGEPGKGEVLKKGMILAIEPMVVEGHYDVVLDKNGWVWRTKDGSRAAHFEHTIVVGKIKAEILTL